MSKQTANDRRCPCHSRKKYRRCCGPYHAGKPAPTPVALMRSRFAAYAMGDADYVMATTDPSGPHYESDADQWKASIVAFCQGTRFASLRIVDWSEVDGRGFVHFEAGLFRGQTDVSFAERSRFVQVQGRWLYTDALG